MKPNLIIRRKSAVYIIHQKAVFQLVALLVALFSLPFLAVTCERESSAVAGPPNIILRDSTPPSRIIVKETLWNLAIVEIDSVEYLSNSKGGLLQLSKK